MSLTRDILNSPALTSFLNHLTECGKSQSTEDEYSQQKSVSSLFLWICQNRSRLLCLTTATKSLFGLSKTDRCNAVGVRNDNMTLRFCGFVVFPQNSFSRSLFYMFYCFMEMFCVFLFSRRIVLIREWLF